MSKRLYEYQTELWLNDPVGASGLPTAEQEQARTAASLKAALDPYYTDHERISLDPEARNLKHTHVKPSEDRKIWRVMQVLVDPEGHNDWQAEFEVDLAASKAAEAPVMRLIGIGPIGA